MLDPKEKSPLMVKFPAGVNIKFPFACFIPSIGSIVIFSTPPYINAILGVAGFKVILFVDMLELSRIDPDIVHPPIVPDCAVKTPLFTENVPALAVMFPVNVPLAADNAPLNVPLPLIVNTDSFAAFVPKDKMESFIPPVP